MVIVEIIVIFPYRFVEENTLIEIVLHFWVLLKKVALKNIAKFKRKQLRRSPFSVVTLFKYQLLQ